MVHCEPTTTQIEVHDPHILAQTRVLLDACQSPREMQEAVLAAVARNEEWRGKRCLNLLAPEAPTSPTVRALLAAEVGTRAAEGHIGAVNRWFAGTKHIDEIEALCVELLKKAFNANYADHRLVASMIGIVPVACVSAPLKLPVSVCTKQRWQPSRTLSHASWSNMPPRKR